MKRSGNMFEPESPPGRPNYKPLNFFNYGT
nr:MAG TPA: hypothetical protein [Microviridae sp.]